MSNPILSWRRVRALPHQTNGGGSLGGFFDASI